MQLRILRIQGFRVQRIRGSTLQGFRAWGPLADPSLSWVLRLGPFCLAGTVQCGFRV